MGISTAFLHVHIIAYFVHSGSCYYVLLYIIHKTPQALTKQIMRSLLYILYSL